MQIDLEEHEWHAVLNAMTYAPMRDVYSIHMKMIRQVGQKPEPPPVKRGNSKQTEAHD